MSTTVGTLVSELRGRSRAVTVRLGDVELYAEGPHAGKLRVGTGEDAEYLAWGDRATQFLTAYVDGPQYKYYRHESLEWQSQIVRHHTTKDRDKEAIWLLEGGNVAGVYSPDSKIIPLSAVAERVANVFDADDVVDVYRGPDQIEVNVVSDLQSVTVPGIPGVLSRPGMGEVEHPSGRKVGDISYGGCRLIMFPGNPEKAPQVQQYWKRLMCLNGMTSDIDGSVISLRGRTVDDILLEMENVMRVIFDGLPASARAIHHSASTPVPGAVSDFIRQVATERGINSRMIVRLQEQAAALPENPSVYDVTQIITALANEENVPVVTRRRLQALGGGLSLDAETAVHRCITCERPLAA